MYLIMEFCAGGDLAAYIRRQLEVKQRRGTYGVSEAVARALMLQLAAGLRAMWNLNLVHVRSCVCVCVCVREGQRQRGWGKRGGGTALTAAQYTQTSLPPQTPQRTTGGGETEGNDCRVFPDQTLKCMCLYAWKMPVSLHSVCKISPGQQHPVGGFLWQSMM
jgi:hypothetical protein